MADLTKADKKLGRLIARVGECTLKPNRQQPYEALIRAVANQQVHAKAADAILGRFLSLYEGKFPDPVALLVTEQAQLRAVGFSYSKIAAIRDIARGACEGIVPTRADCKKLTDAEIIERLTSLRGVGRWTVEMLLIFTLGRMDILPVDDFGIREGYRLHWKQDEQPKPKELRLYGERWEPWRTVASWYLWRGVEIYRKAG